MARLPSDAEAELRSWARAMLWFWATALLPRVAMATEVASDWQVLVPCWTTVVPQHADAHVTGRDRGRAREQRERHGQQSPEDGDSALSRALRTRAHAGAHVGSSCSA